jgi:hypothetical protein
MHREENGQFRNKVGNTVSLEIETLGEQEKDGLEKRHCIRNGSITFKPS